jgi:hypothetical protein
VYCQVCIVHFIAKKGYEVFWKFMGFETMHGAVCEDTRVPNPFEVLVCKV